MFSFRTISLPMFALVAALAGCSSDPGTSAGPDTASTAKQEQSVAGDGNGTKGGPDGRGPHGHHGPGGPGGPEFLIGAALHSKDLGLNDAQRSTIEALAKPGGDRPDHRERPAFDQTKAKDLATAIRAGNVSSLPKGPGPDAAQLQQHIAESAAKLKTLHDTLTADQRAKLVADIQSHAPKGDKGPRGPGGPEGRGPHPEMRGGPHGGPGMPFGEDLNLTDAQKEQLRAKFEANHPKPDFEKMKTEMNTKLESFKADSFDATAFVTPPAQLQPKMDGNPLADLVSVLTPEQREILAKKIEAGPPAPPPAPQQ